jgi:hypothetical protein
MSRDGVHVAAFCVLAQLFAGSALERARRAPLQLEVSADGASASLMQPGKKVKGRWFGVQSLPRV